MKSLRLGGIMVWMMGDDDFGAKCGEKYPLLK